jgi:hypothetical protein
MIKLQY